MHAPALDFICVRKQCAKLYLDWLESRQDLWGNRLQRQHSDSFGQVFLILHYSQGMGCA